MFRLLYYSAYVYLFQLTQAQEGVSSELNRLNSAKEDCLDKINETFQHIQDLMNQRKEEIIENVNTICAEKRRILEEQHALIESEKTKVSFIYNTKYRSDIHGPRIIKNLKSSILM